MYNCENCICLKFPFCCEIIANFCSLTNDDKLKLLKEILNELKNLIK